MNDTNLVWFCASLCFSAIFSSCKPGELSSQLQHDFGDTSVKPKHALVDCHSNSSQAFVTKKGQFPKSTAYIKQIAQHLMNANSSTFAGPYASSKFCFETQYEPSYNAYAVPTHREVVFHTGALLTFRNDAEVAAVMAHELAHITMQHAGVLTHSDFKKIGAHAQGLSQQLDQIREQLNSKSTAITKLHEEIKELMDDIAASSREDRDAVQNIRAIEQILMENSGLELISPTQWKGYADQLSKHYATIMGGAHAENGVAVRYKVDEVARLEKELNDISIRSFNVEDEFRNAAAEKIGGFEQLSNGKEREADEVGYELYLRARMHPGHFLAAESNGVQEVGVGQQLAAYLYCIKNMLVNLRIEPYRGYSTHPTGCWRLYNIFINENLSHKDDYKDLFAAARQTTIPGAVTLAEVRKEIEDFEKANPNNPQPQNLDPFNIPKPDPEAIALKKAVCERMGGQLQEYSGHYHCELPNLATKAEKKAYCESNNLFWHDKCECLPAEWAQEELDENACLPKRFVNETEFNPGYPGQGPGSNSGTNDSLLSP